MNLFQLTNWRQEFNQYNFFSSEYKLVYKPGKIGESQLFGYVVDFQIYADLRSLSEVSVPIGEPLASEAEQAEAFYNLYKYNPFKKLGVYSSADDGQTFQRHFGTYLFNRRPYYYVDLLPSLTKAASLQVGKDGISGNPISWYLRLEPDGETQNTGELNIGDTISVLISANEEAPRIAEIKPIILSMSLTPGIQNTLVVPEGTLSYCFKIRNNPGDNLAPVRFAWQSGVVAAGGGYTLEENSEESETGIFLINKKIYFATDTDNVTILFKGWV